MSFVNDVFKISISPGIRYEYINTKAIGNYKKINLDGAGNVIQEQTLLENQQINVLFFFLESVLIISSMKI